jgi:hypothetical protein
MAVIDYYTGFTKEQVSKILAIQQEELPKTIAAWTDSGSSVQKRKLDEIHAIIAGCQAALRKFDPETYGRGRRVVQSTVDHIPR